MANPLTSWRDALDDVAASIGLISSRGPEPLGLESARTPTPPLGLQSGRPLAPGLGGGLTTPGRGITPFGAGAQAFGLADTADPMVNSPWGRGWAARTEAEGAQAIADTLARTNDPLMGDPIYEQAAKNAGYPTGLEYASPAWSRAHPPRSRFLARCSPHGHSRG